MIVLRTSLHKSMLSNTDLSFKEGSSLVRSKEILSLGFIMKSHLLWLYRKSYAKILEKI